VQYLLAKLGSSEQVMVTLALGSTAAIVMGKMGQDVSKRVSSTASIRMPGSAASTASSASAAPAKQPVPSGSFEEQDAL